MFSFTKRMTIICLLMAQDANADIIPVGEFSDGKLQDWQAKIFSGKTTYRLTANGNNPQQTVLEAHSLAAASGLIRKIKIDLRKTPYLNWSWKIQNILQGPDETSKAGDDYPARIYVVVSGGLAFWNSKSINYVWANRLEVGSQWHNAYTNQAYMLALQSGNQETGKWKMERRNVRDDFKALYTTDLEYIDAIAIMTDTDQTKGETRAWYGDIWFSSE